MKINYSILPRQQVASVAYVKFSLFKIVCRIPNLYLLPIFIKQSFSSTTNYHSDPGINKHHSKSPDYNYNILRLQHYSKSLDHILKKKNLNT